MLCVLKRAEIVFKVGMANLVQQFLVDLLAPFSPTTCATGSDPFDDRCRTHA
jgi:hypothetical protein